MAKNSFPASLVVILVIVLGFIGFAGISTAPGGAFTLLGGGDDVPTMVEVMERGGLIPGTTCECDMPDSYTPMAGDVKSGCEDPLWEALCGVSRPEAGGGITYIPGTCVTGTPGACNCDHMEPIETPETPGKNPYGPDGPDDDGDGTADLCDPDFQGHDPTCVGLLACKACFDKWKPKLGIYSTTVFICDTAALVCDQYKCRGQTTVHSTDQVTTGPPIDGTKCQGGGGSGGGGSAA